MTRSQAAAASRPTPTDFPYLQQALDLLLQAHDLAQRLEQDAWQFSVALPELEQTGLAHAVIRWLLHENYIEQALETTQPDAQQRTFQPAHNLALTPASCFILTAHGLAHVDALTANDGDDVLPFPRASAAGAANPLPHWHADRRELYLGDTLIKRFRRPAPNQILVLTAFEEDGWPHRIDNPLPPVPDLCNAVRLQETIRALNNHQQHALIRFHGDGTGEGVTWELVPTSPGDRTDITQRHDHPQRPS